MRYPGSRTKSSGQCDKCKDYGNMQDSGRLMLKLTNGNTVELMKWTCDTCGYTMLFDLDIPRTTPYASNEYREILPG
jgi:uncharacterized cysteine cluster protein YcgN (CxxCxxCC family)